MIDSAGDRYLHSIANLVGVAGVLVSPASDLVFTSNRGDNTVGIIAPEDEKNLVKIPVGIRPNGLAYDPGRRLLLVAHVGDSAVSDSQTVMLVDVAARQVVVTVPVPGRTRWAIFDGAGTFYVNIADLALIVVIKAAQPTQIARTITIPISGPHGLEIDLASGRLFCACDGGQLAAVDSRSGTIQQQAAISGAPDVIFYNDRLKHLYVAVGDPGVIDVFDTPSLTRIETVPTARGAHTLAFDARQNKIYAFLPETHRAAIYVDRA